MNVDHEFEYFCLKKNDFNYTPQALVEAITCGTIKNTKKPIDINKEISVIVSLMTTKQLLEFINWGYNILPANQYENIVEEYYNRIKNHK